MEKIYTKTGDAGETGLFGGARVSKSDARVDAYGEVDELNAWLGVVRAKRPDADIDAMLDHIQRDLFAVGATLADPRKKIAARVTKAALDTASVDRLEGWIDTLEAELPPLRKFILAGGSEAGALLHAARAVCRRAERRVVGLGSDAVDAVVLVYLNPISDLLFVMARAVNHRAGVPGVRVVAEKAYAACARLARAHYENFPVASVLLPHAMRPHIAAIYAFARTADDLADEGAAPDEVRIQQLEQWREWLRAAASGRPFATAGTDADAIFTALAQTIRTCNLDVGLFEDLLSAFTQDVTVKRYENWDRLLDYCRRSANPVGRLVLAVAGVRDADAARASDALCTALQLTNFWQDLAVDWGRGRLYVPRSILVSTGASEDDLNRGELTPAWRLSLKAAAARARELFETGRIVADRVHGRLRWELRATWLGGVRILDRLEQADYDVFRHRPSLGWADAPAIAWRAVAWKPE